MEVTADDATMKQHQAWREMWESETCRPFTTREIAFAEMVVAAERHRCRLATHDAIMCALDEAGVYNDVLRGICVIAAMERFEDELGR